MIRDTSDFLRNLEDLSPGFAMLFSITLRWGEGVTPDHDRYRRFFGELRPGRSIGQHGGPANRVQTDYWKDGEKKREAREKSVATISGETRRENEYDEETC